MTSQEVPEKIGKLVETFEQNLDSYRSSRTETELRREFLDEFFGLYGLGWDISNSKRYDEAGKEVVHEFSVDVAGQQKKADYAFRVGRGSKFDFLVEAKKPSVKIESDQESAFQLRRYGWSAKMPINILTDFEHFAVYDCRTKPNISDKASIGRVMLIHYKDYVSRWNEIADIFSPEAIRRGSFDKYAEGAKGKKGTADVDDVFLEEIERWRTLLARNIALRNPEIDVAGLNYAVQMTIDRIVFLRICEERGIEPDNQLRDTVGQDTAYEALCDLFRKADTKYNSGLFHFNPEKGQSSIPDDMTLNLKIDSKVLSDIVSNLYYPKSPYAFLYIPSDILGQVYERFLGKVIRLTAGHQAKVEEKPEVRKAGGVYYTPTYIVDYIVSNTVGKLVEGKSPKEVDQLKIVDPACGSGSFLLGAYQFLLDWHLNWYTVPENEPSKWEKKAILKTRDGYRLTTAKKKEILIQNIYGVDIDAQAVEVTKLSLLLKVLENPSGQMDLGLERVLPDLGKNIQHGNSLIGSDFYDQMELTLLDQETRSRINVFDWQQSFPEAFKQGGFDCVIGNPPYVLLQADFRDDNQLEYFRQHYSAASYKIDTYHLFIEKALDLLRSDGLSSYITPSNYLSNNYLEPLRRVIMAKSSLEEITLFDYPVFHKVSVDTAVFFASKTAPKSQVQFKKVAPDKMIELATCFNVSRESILQRDGLLFLGQSSTGHADIIAKMKSVGISLGNIATVNFGKQLRNRKIFTEDVIEIPNDQSIPKSHVACLTGSNINRYEITWGSLACWLSDEARCGGCWDATVHNAKGKLICRQIGKRPFFGIDIHGYHCLNTVFMVLPRESKPSVHYLLGILNSQLLGYFWEDQFFDQRKTFPKIKGTYLKQLPIRPIDFGNSADVALHDKMVPLVERMLELNKKKAEGRNPVTLSHLQSDISITDRQIDRLVYELYALSPEEIAIVEGGKA